MRFLPTVAFLLAAAVWCLPTALAAPAASYADSSYSWSAADSADASYNWSGYVSAGGTYTGVSASWVVPAAKGSGESLGADAAWVGIGGVTSGDLIQAGTQALVGPDGTQYEAWYETLPGASNPVPLAVSAGDKVEVLLAQTAPGEWSINFKNDSTGKTYALSIAYDSSLSSAEWIQEMPSSERGGNFVPLDNFDTIAFSDAKAIENGSTVSLAQTNAQPLRMVNAAGETLAAPSALAQDGFAVMRTNASAGSFSARPRHWQIVIQQF